jgi:HSP20 family protein
VPVERIGSGTALGSRRPRAGTNGPVFPKELRHGLAIGRRHVAAHVKEERKMTTNTPAKTMERRERPPWGELTPWMDFAPWSARMQQLMEQMFSPALFASDFAPGGELRETDEAFLLELDLPAVKKEDITIDFSGRRLRVHGTKTTEADGKGELRHTTRSSGTFVYEAILPAPVDESAVTAALADGVLTVTMPKAPEAKTTHITIT